jgi:hypothetical protein
MPAGRAEALPAPELVEPADPAELELLIPELDDPDPAAPDPDVPAPDAPDPVVPAALGLPLPDVLAELLPDMPLPLAAVLLRT